jgi:hypothetical protein
MKKGRKALRHDKHTRADKLLSGKDGEIIGKEEKMPMGENKYLREVLKLRKTIPNWTDMYFIPAEDEDNEVVKMDRIQQQIRVEVIGQQLCSRYSWVRISPTTFIFRLHHRHNRQFQIIEH